MMNNENNSITDVKSERGIPSVNADQLSTNHRVLIALFVVLCIVVTSALLYATIKKHQQKIKQEAIPEELHASTAPAHTFNLPPTALPEKPADNKLAAPTVDSGKLLPLDQATQIQEMVSLDKSASALMVANDHAQKESTTDSNKSTTPVTPQDTAGNGALDGMLSSTTTTLRKATQLSDRNMLLAKGSFIDCVLQTRLDSTVPGMTSCIVTRNIYSDNGKVLLIERGSQAIGEYQSNLKQGQNRIFVLWSRIKTPHGVVIALDSPGADPLGGSGLSGYVDTHFWERFGGALMLSLVQDAFATAASNSTNNSQVTVQNTSDATQNMAAEALKSTINIPPTLYKNQGERVGIYVARDLDFGSVYDLSRQ